MLCLIVFLPWYIQFIENKVKSNLKKIGVQKNALMLCRIKEHIGIINHPATNLEHLRRHFLPAGP